MQDVPLDNDRQPELQKGVIACCSAIHQSVERNSALYFEQLRRHNYVSCLCQHCFATISLSIPFEAADSLSIPQLSPSST